MNTILIVGHPFSGYDLVEQSLIDSGMNPPLPTQRDKVTPAEIDGMLCQSRGIKPFDDGGSHFDYPVEQIAVGSVWNAMITDLLISNASSPLWGWADPMAVYLLDFWKDAVPDLTFVLVYNHPKTALHGLLEAAGNTPDPGCVDEAAQSWISFNEAILNFFHHNSDRCLLVHSEEILSPQEPGEASMSLLLKGESSGKLSATHATRNIEFSKNRSIATTNDTDKGRGRTDEIVLVDFMSSSVFPDTSNPIRLYEQIQEIATVSGGRLMSPMVNSEEAMRALLLIVGQRKQLANEKLLLDDRLRDLSAENDAAIQERDESLREKNIFEAQLAVVQEALEVNHQEKEKSVRRIASLESEMEVLLRQWAEKHPEGAEARVKGELPYLIGSVIISHAKTVWKLLFLPFTLWLVAMKFRRQQRKTKKTLPPVEAYSDFEKGQKVRAHLSYLLGRAWLMHIHKPWNFLVMPWALLNAYLTYRKQKKRKS